MCPWWNWIPLEPPTVICYPQQTTIYCGLEEFYIPYIADSFIQNENLHSFYALRDKMIPDGKK